MRCHFGITFRRYCPLEVYTNVCLLSVSICSVWQEPWENFGQVVQTSEAKGRPGEQLEQTEPDCSSAALVYIFRINIPSDWPERCLYCSFPQIAKQHVHMRFSNLFVCPELLRSTMPRSCDLGRMISVTGVCVEEHFVGGEGVWERSVCGCVECSGGLRGGKWGANEPRCCGF